MNLGKAEKKPRNKCSDTPTPAEKCLQHTK